MTLLRMLIQNTERTNARIKQLAENIREGMRAAWVHDFAVRTRKHLIENIEQQTLDLPPLSPTYLASKVKAGYDSRTLIRTGTYLKSIIIEENVQDNDTNGYNVMLDPEARTDKGESYGQVAFWLEYGTRRMPARPHWRPTVAWAEKEWPKHMKAWVDSSVRRSR